MENPSTFSLFKLPLVATEHVFSMFNPFELIDLSLTSIRARKIVSHFYKSKFHEKFRVCFKIGEKPYIRLDRLGTRYRVYLTSDKSKEGFENISGTSNTRNHYKYSEDVVEGLVKYYEHLKKVVECEIGTFKIDMGIFENRSIIDWLKNQQEAIEKVVIKLPKKAMDDDVKYFLDNIKVSKIFHMFQYNFRKDDFQLNLSECLDRLHICDSKFLTLEKLLEINSREIRLENSPLTNRELNMFLKSWMSCESHLNLEAFDISGCFPLNVEEIFDLPHEVTSDPYSIEIIRKRLYTFEATNGFVIKRSDGKVATLYMHKLWFLGFGICGVIE